MDLISISDAFISSLIFGITSSQSPPNELTPSTSDFILSLPQFHTSTILPLLESEILQFSQSNAQSLSCLPSFFLLYRDILVQNNVFPTLPASTESMLSALANLLSKNPQYAFSGKTLALTTSALGAPSTSQVPPTSLFQARLPFSQSESRSFSYLESHDWRTSIAYGTKQLATAIFSPPPPTAIAVLREVPVINVVPFVDPCSTVPVYESDSLILTGFSTNEPSSEHDFVHAAIEANVSKVFSNMASRPKVKAKFKAKPKVKVKPKEKEKVKPKPKEKEKEKKEKEKKEKKKKEKKEGGEEEKELKRAEKEKKKAAKAAALAAAEDDNDDVNDDTDNDNNAKKEPRASQVRWTAIADSQLRQAKLDPTASWSDVAASITHIVKNPTQARDRWTNFVRPTISLDPWTLEEDLLLVERQNTLGNKWGAIQEGLEGRTEHGCRQRHKAIIKKLGKIGESVLTEENRIDGSIGVPQLPQLPSELPKEMVIEETLEMDIDLGLIIDTIEMLV